MLSIPVEMLPVQLRLIAEQCSHETAMALLNHFGGCHLSVPKTPATGHQLIEVLGWQRFKQLCSNYGGEILSIPKAQAAIRAARNQKIQAERRSGLMLSEIARRHNLTERHIMVILKDA